MDLLQANSMKVVVAGGDLAAAPQRSLKDDVLQLDIEQFLVEQRTSESRSPKARYRTGYNGKAAGMMANVDLDQMVEMIGGSHAADVFTLTFDSFNTMPLYDVEFGILDGVSGTNKTIKITNVQFMGNVSLPFQAGEFTYLPFELGTTKTSVLTIDNS